MGGEVPAVLFGFMRDALVCAGIETAPHLEGLRLAHARTRRIGERVDWDELATFLNRVAESLSEKEQERVGESYVQANRYWQVVCGLAMTPEILFKAGWYASRPAFPHFEWCSNDLPGGRIELSMVMPERYEPCPFFFRATAGELRALPRLLGLPDAELEAEIGLHTGIFRVRPPDSRALVRRVAGAGRAADRLARDVLAMIERSFRTRSDDPPSPRRRLQRAHGLTPAEARVAVRLAEGRSVPQIAEELGISVATVRTHLKRAFAKTGTHRQAELVRVVLLDSPG